MDVEHEKEFQEILGKCLQQPVSSASAATASAADPSHDLQIWTRDQMRLLHHMRGGGSASTSPPALAVSLRSKSTTQSHQLDKQMQNLCLAMTEKALNNV